jgi:uncharacterized membrane protein
MTNTQGLAQHHAAVTVNAPVHQVYGLFTHFNDFPKFMSFVKEVTYYDNQHSHWVAEVAGNHEWDAVNTNWVEDRQIGWQSTNGLENNGQVTFQPAGANQTRVDVYVNYNPPAGVLGDVGERLGAGNRFDAALQHDLDNFARMVDQAPSGALDPTSSNYLFHGGSAAAQGKTTQHQDATMDRDNNDNAGYTTTNTNINTPGADTIDRPIMDQDIIANPDDPAAAKQANPLMSQPQPDSGPTPIMPNDEGSPNSIMPPDRGVTR